MSGEGSHSVQRILERGVSELELAGIADAPIHASLLLRQALGWSRAELIARKHERPPAEATGYFFQLIERRRGRIPTQYLVGAQEFWGLEFRVTPSVLIPRPETELLIEQSLKELPRNEELLVADIGCGSGCIAVSLAKELPEARFIAVDLSPSAVAVATDNAVRHDVSSRIMFIVGDLLEPVGHVLAELPRDDCDAIVSNPPYIESDGIESLEPEVKDHEPRSALDGGADGLDIIRRLVAESPRYMAPGALLLFEIGFGQSKHVLALAEGSPLSDVRVVDDLQSIPRVVVARRD